MKEETKKIANFNIKEILDIEDSEEQNKKINDLEIKLLLEAAQLLNSLKENKNNNQ